MSKITNLSLPHKLKEPGRHEVGDGLWLKVLDPDRAYWVFRYRVNGSEREVSLGPARKVTLPEARKQHAVMRGMVVQDVDPRPIKEEARPPTFLGRTFDQAAAEYIDDKERLGVWKNKKHAEQWRSTIALLPESFRSKRPAEITVTDVYEALKPIWERTPETAARLRARIEAIIEEGRGPEDYRLPNPGAWSGWLKRQLGDWRKLGKIDRKTGERVARGNHKTMFYEEVPAFMAKVRERSGVAAQALEFAILTAARTSEVVAAPWSEFNLDARTWTIPASRMKMSKEHRVPLSDRAMEILRAREKERDDSGYVFASPPMGRGRILDHAPLSNMALLALLNRMKEPVTAHGFRASFKVWAGAFAHAEEKTRDRCLAHSTNDPYDQDDRFTQRRPLMQRWADYCAGGAGATIVPFKRGV
jgi:integrase